jgi:enoyl-CoA hydratase/carnithine racemase
MDDYSLQDDLIDINVAESVARLTFNRPDSRNSLSLAMIASLHNAIMDAGANKDVKAVVLAGKGPAFCAGHDLKEMTAARKGADRGKAFFSKTMENCSNMMLEIVRCPKPVIAAVDGIATAAGCQLVATCDLAVAGQSSRFATPGVNIGLFCSTPMVAVSRNLPRKRVMQMLLMGEMIPADTAAEWGLVNQVVDDGTALEHAMAIASAIAEKSSATVKIGKEAFYNQIDMPLEESYRYTAQVMVENMLHRDAEEGINAFIEKRKPEWQE